MHLYPISGGINVSHQYHTSVETASQRLLKIEPMSNYGLALSATLRIFYQLLSIFTLIIAHLSAGVLGK